MMSTARMLGAGALLTLATSVSAMADEVREVVMKHLRGFGALDVDAMTAPFSDDARIISTKRIYRGKPEVREFMESLVAEFSQPDISNETHEMVADGNVFMLTWSAESPDKVYEYGVDTYIVENGEIILLTTAARTNPK